MELLIVEVLALLAAWCSLDRVVHAQLGAAAASVADRVKVALGVGILLDALARMEQACLIVIFLGVEWLVTPGARHSVSVDKVGERAIVHVGPLVMHVVALPHLLGTLVLELDRVDLVDVLVNQATELGGLAATFRGDGDHVDEFLHAHPGGTGSTCKLEHLLELGL